MALKYVIVLMQVENAKEFKCSHLDFSIGNATQNKNKQWIQVSVVFVFHIFILKVYCILHDIFGPGRVHFSQRHFNTSSNLINSTVLP